MYIGKGKFVSEVEGKPGDRYAYTNKIVDCKGFQRLIGGYGIPYVVILDLVVLFPYLFEFGPGKECQFVRTLFYKVVPV